MAWRGGRLVPGPGDRSGGGLHSRRARAGPSRRMADHRPGADRTPDRDRRDRSRGGDLRPDETALGLDPLTARIVLVDRPDVPIRILEGKLAPAPGLVGRLARDAQDCPFIQAAL